MSDIDEIKARYITCKCIENRQRAEAAEAREKALRRYARHDIGCQKGQGHGTAGPQAASSFVRYPCSCGLDAALATDQPEKGGDPRADCPWKCPDNAKACLCLGRKPGTAGGE